MLKVVPKIYIISFASLHSGSRFETYMSGYFVVGDGVLSGPSITGPANKIGGS